MNLKTKLTTAIATGAVLLNSLVPAALAADVTVSGNGAFSDNTANVSTSNNTTVSQTNDANVTNHVDSNASTGGNDASFNTGGATTINTGNASTNTTVTNDLNTNVANVESCTTCNGGGSDVTISGNGAFSDNTARVANNSDVVVSQNNDANVRNNVDSNATTGHNNAGFNTGGDTTINTGNASTNTSVSTLANRNVANVSGAGGSGGSSVQILGNGAFSDNTARLWNSSATVLDQNNDAHVVNRVDSNAKTGGNDANFSTGGDVSINTGDAKTKTTVANAVNFNAADVDCGCIVGDLNVKISGNGAESSNKVWAKSLNDHLVFQDNQANLFNKVDNDAKTGHNASKFSTGNVDGDPSISTGNAGSATTVQNSGNMNTAGQGASLRFPGNLGVDFDFDLSGLFNALSFNK